MKVITSVMDIGYPLSVRVVQYMICVECVCVTIIVHTCTHTHTVDI